MDKSSRSTSISNHPTQQKSGILGRVFLEKRKHSNHDQDRSTANDQVSLGDMMKEPFMDLKKKVVRFGQGLQREGKLGDRSKKRQLGLSKYSGDNQSDGVMSKLNNIRKSIRSVGRQKVSLDVSPVEHKDLASEYPIEPRILTDEQKNASREIIKVVDGIKLMRFDKEFVDPLSKAMDKMQCQPLKEVVEQLILCAKTSRSRKRVEGLELKHDSLSKLSRSLDKLCHDRSWDSSLSAEIKLVYVALDKLNDSITSEGVKLDLGMFADTSAKKVIQGLIDQIFDVRGYLKAQIQVNNARLHAGIKKVISGADLQKEEVLKSEIQQYGNRIEKLIEEKSSIPDVRITKQLRDMELQMSKDTLGSYKPLLINDSEDILSNDKALISRIEKLKKRNDEINKVIGKYQASPIRKMLNKTGIAREFYRFLYRERIKNYRRQLQDLYNKRTHVSTLMAELHNTQDRISFRISKISQFDRSIGELQKKRMLKEKELLSLKIVRELYNGDKESFDADMMDEIKAHTALPPHPDREVFFAIRYIAAMNRLKHRKINDLNDLDQSTDSRISLGVTKNASDGSLYLVDDSREESVWGDTERRAQEFQKNASSFQLMPQSTMSYSRTDIDYEHGEGTSKQGGSSVLSVDRKSDIFKRNRNKRKAPLQPYDESLNPFAEDSDLKVRQEEALVQGKVEGDVKIDAIYNQPQRPSRKRDDGRHARMQKLHLDQFAEDSDLKVRQEEARVQVEGDVKIDVIPQRLPHINHDAKSALYDKTRKPQTFVVTADVHNGSYSQDTKNARALFTNEDKRLSHERRRLSLQLSNDISRRDLSSNSNRYTSSPMLSRDEDFRSQLGMFGVMGNTNEFNDLSNVKRGTIQAPMRHTLYSSEQQTHRQFDRLSMIEQSSDSDRIPKDHFVDMGSDDRIESIPDRGSTNDIGLSKISNKNKGAAHKFRKIFHIDRHSRDKMKHTVDKKMKKWTR